MDVTLQLQMESPIFTPFVENSYESSLGYGIHIITVENVTGTRTCIKNCSKYCTAQIRC